MLSREQLLRSAENAGFHRVRILNTSDCGYPFPAGSLLLCALSCYRDEADDQSVVGEPHGLIAPFARRNTYAESVRRLKDVLDNIRQKTGLKRRDARIFCNSRIPEKELANRAGLGFYGRNSLIIAPGLGSCFVISGIYLPFDYASDPRLSEDSAPGACCKSCRACIEACPVGAVSGNGTIDRTQCLQSLSTQLVPFPDRLKELWQFRIYGCQSCQSVCPFNRDLSMTTGLETGVIGPSLPLQEILSRKPDELRRYFKGTVLDQNWVPMEAIQRNALIAAGNREDPVMLPLLARYRNSGLRDFRDAAHWAMQVIQSKN